MMDEILVTETHSEKVDGDTKQSFYLMGELLLVPIVIWGWPQACGGGGTRRRTLMSSS